MSEAPTPRSDAAWRTAIAQLNQRDEREDPQHVALIILADQLEVELATAIRERDEAQQAREKIDAIACVFALERDEARQLAEKYRDERYKWGLHESRRDQTRLPWEKP